MKVWLMLVENSSWKTNFSRCVLFHMKSWVNLKYFVSYCRYGDKMWYPPMIDQMISFTDIGVSVERPVEAWHSTILIKEGLVSINHRSSANIVYDNHNFEMKFNIHYWLRCKNVDINTRKVSIFIGDIWNYWSLINGI